IIGVNTDASVRRQGKGEERPINALEARSILLAALAFVNGVVTFDEDTPIHLIERIQPDVLVKGADYDPQVDDPKDKKYIVGRNEVLHYGGDVQVIDLVAGFSTTNIVNKLQK